MHGNNTSNPATKTDAELAKLAVGSGVSIVSDDVVQRQNSYSAAVLRGAVVPVFLQARWKLARTDDDVEDAGRALALAKASERAARPSETSDESFNVWLSANGYRFM